MGFLADKTVFSPLTKEILEESISFSCGNEDLDGFFHNDAVSYAENLFGKSYCYYLEESKADIVCAFTVSNASSTKFQHLHIGTEVMDFIKSWFVEPYNKTGCRYLVVDAYNEDVPVAFYKKNGFDFMFSTEEQEKSYRGIVSDKPLKTRLMYFDLILIK